MINKAALVICFDHGYPENEEDLARSLLFSKNLFNNQGNRYYDKPFQYVVFENSKIGLIGEHSGVDGLPVGSFIEWVLEKETELHSSNYLIGPETIDVIDDVPVKLPFVLDDVLNVDLSRAEYNLYRLIEKTALHVLHFTDYGSDFLKACEISPDSWFQFAMQLAYFRIHGKIGATYESGGTGRFRRGRTETVRSVSVQSVAFVKGMTNPKLNKSQKLALLKAASKTHVDYMKKATNGFGVDRHLLGLKLIAIEKGDELHPIYLDPIFSQSSHWNLSTSQLKLDKINYTGFGPVVEDGYGVCYSLRKTHIRASIASFIQGGTCGFSYRSNLILSLKEMRDLFINPKL